ncbi:hypothetical protein DFP72DRAFT_1061526 [Ephemerocybe angulata]|uniref:Uncharacterized protein n=1 Tax=Ephemerocybe angulata TaxID=980116 RepID=A0A8H6MDW5_9AGAR|nr:hypothetical protein DFP72DRAFT_1061526 [Tulosesus angulatus]
MRRFVSVFSSKRDKHGNNDKGSKPALSTPQMGSASSKAALKPLTIPFLAHTSATVRSPASSSFSTPHLSSGSTDPSSHSSDSSNESGSLHIQTPDDQHSLNLSRVNTKRSWKSWIGKKRSGSLKHRKDKTIVDSPIPHWEPLELPISPQLLTPTAPSQSPTTSTPPSPALALSNFSVLIRNGLVRTTAQPSPFIQPASGPIYPRSCNRPQVLRSTTSLRSSTLKKRLRRRLDDPSFLPDPSILVLGSRPTPVELAPSVLPDCDIPYPDRSMKILSSSPGVHRWICRPCFEDRFTIFLSTEAGVQSKPVSSSFAVAALEYSEALDVMVDPDYELVLDKVLPLSPSESVPPMESPSATAVEIAPMPTVEASQSGKSSPPFQMVQAIKLTILVAPVAPVPQSRNSYIANPSPLRIQHTRAASEASPTILQEAESMSTVQGSSPPKKKSATGTTAVKRVVRFAEDDDDEDDALPLHLLRVKKKREEKAKFLRMEQQRRMREAFEEQKRQEMESLERERKRVAAQKEREERDKRLFAERVVASRLRSEQSRAGAYVTESGSSSSLLVPSATSGNLRDAERNSPRASKVYPSKHGEASSQRVDGSSSGSSKSPSLRPSPSPVPQQSTGSRSRPPSTYSNTSSDDMRPSSGSRRNSYANSLNGSMRSGMTVPYPAMYSPMWAGSHQSLNPMQMQMVPNFAAFAAVNDMPLLPPNAPFMKHSRQPSPSSDKRSDRTSSHSRERRDANRNSSASSTKEKSGSPASTSQWPNHRRQSSGDSKASGKSSKVYPQHTGESSSTRHRPTPTTSQSTPQMMSRGRPPIPSFQSTPPVSNPWTALPSQTGYLPRAMPTSSYSHSLPQNRNSGFVGPMGHDWRSTLIS